MKYSIAIILLVLVAVVAFGAAKNKPPADVPLESRSAPQVYSSEEYGLSFSYPSSYFLEEKEIDVSNRIHHEIVLTEDTDWNRKVRSGEVADTEGPVAITIDIYQNNLDKMSEASFVMGTNDSNYKLGDGTVSTTTRGSLTGLEYTWSGLYEGRSFVKATPRYVYMFSVTRLEPGDEIITVFNQMLETVRIEE